MINAFPEDWNPGMLSVDFSLGHVIRNAGLDASVEYFTGEVEYALEHLDGRRVWHAIESVNDLAQHDVIIYWGDFLHWIGYARHDWQRRQAINHPGQSAQALLDRYYRIMLQPEENLYEKIILFGGTIYPLDISDLLDSRYTDALKKLLARARLVKFRDMVSAAYAAHLSGKNNNYLGCDCAFLLDTNDIAGAGSACPDGYIGFSFGRTGNSEPLLAFAHKVGKAMGLPLVNIGWLSTPGQFANKISLIKGAKFVITDIYHLSVTSLRENKPVFCIGSGCSYSSTTLSDKKKEFLFKQYLADCFYLFYEHVIEPKNFAHLLCRISSLSENLPVQDQLFGMIKSSVEKSRTVLLASISGNDS